MKRIALRTRPAALIGAGMLIALLVFLPMRLALGWAGLGEQGLVARRVSGSVWGATLTEARFGDLVLGDLSARLSPLPLFIGRARIALAGPDRTSAAPLRAALTVSRSAIGLDDATGSLPTGRVFAPLPVTTLDLDDLTVRFRDGRCEAAEGRVRASLAGDAAGLPLPATVSGAARCDGGALLLPLASQAGTEAISLRIEGNGRYRADLTVQSTDPMLAVRLQAAGFTATTAGYLLSIQGRFW
ncbi:type II secretion system protein N [uncultured Sphingomonas sp.]|uniref:type II secretion system protein N n=1 Tax=uncultured Sphingomonas sp. TaxID=158754 RepID=UPI0035C9AFB0